MSFEILDYTAKAGMGFNFPARTIIKEDEKDIFIFSPGPHLYKDYIGSKQIHLIAPNNFHHLFIKHSIKQLSLAKVYGNEKTQKKTKIDMLSHSLIPDAFERYHLSMSKFVDETLFYHKETKTLITTDFVFNYQKDIAFMTSLMLRFAGTYKKCAISKLLLKSITDKKAFSQLCQQLLDLDINEVIINHGDPISVDQFKSTIKDAVSKI